MENGKKNGFTLLEIIMVVVVVAILSLLIAQVFFTTLRSNTKSEVLREVKQNGDFALESMVRMIQNAVNVTSACSESGTASQTLTITNPDSGITTFECDLDGTVTRIASRSGSGTGYLTSSKVTLGGASCAESSFLFVCASAPGVAPAVKISFELSQAGVAQAQFEQASVSFQTTVTGRNIRD